MFANCSKIKTYIGFAIKSRNIVYGIDDILNLKSKCKLILVSNLLSENSLNKLETNAHKFNLPLKIIEHNEFYEIINNESIKVIALTDKNLSDAILNQISK